MSSTVARSEPDAAGPHELCASLLASQWQYLRALEALDPPRAAQVQDAAGRMTLDRPLAPLQPWEGLTPEHFAAYQRPKNQYRLRRLLDYLLTGERVLDVGCGFGYAPGILLRDGPLAYYCGIDLGAHRVRAAFAMLAANPVAHVPAHFEVRSLFDIDAPFMQRHRPTFVILCEVLEHLSDPVAGLTAVMRHAPPGTSILFSVPMAGRLENVKGHVSFFNADRLQTLCERARLIPQYVEPVFNTWVYVLAASAPADPRRVLHLCARAAPETAPAPTADADFHRPARRPAIAAARDAAPPAEALRFTPVSWDRPPAEYLSWWNHRTHRVHAERAADGVRCRVWGAAAGEGGQYGGLRFETPGARGARLDLSLEHPSHIISVHVAGYSAGARRPVVHWVWKSRGGVLPAGRQCLTLVPGQPAPPFEEQPGGRDGRMDEVHVFIRIVPGTEAGFTLHRAEVASALERQPSGRLSVRGPDEDATS